jgi:hypothetical protein
VPVFIRDGVVGCRELVIFVVRVVDGVEPGEVNRDVLPSVRMRGTLRRNCHFRGNIGVECVRGGTGCAVTPVAPKRNHRGSKK